MIMMSDIEILDDPQLRENVACQLNTKFGRNPTREEIDDEMSRYEVSNCGTCLSRQ